MPERKHLLWEVFPLLLHMMADRSVRSAVVAKQRVLLFQFRMIVMTIKMIIRRLDIVIIRMIKGRMSVMIDGWAVPITSDSNQ